MAPPKVLINAQWRPEHFATPVSPGFKATPLAERMVPGITAVSFIEVDDPALSVRDESGHPSFLLRSVAKDPARGTKFVPDEAAGSNPVEGSLQCVHGNTGLIMPLPHHSWPSPPLPGAINCGVVQSSDVQCLANLEDLAQLFAERMLQELMGSPWQFFQDFRGARAASNAKWAGDLPGRIWDGITDTLGAIWDGIKWIGGKIGGAAQALYDDPMGALASTGQAISDGAQAAYDAVNGASDVLSDPAKRDAILEAIKDWVKESFAELACEMAEALLEMLRSDKPLAAQLGEVAAMLEQQAAEVAGQVAITVLGDKGLSKLAMVAKASKMNPGAFGKLFDRIGDAAKGKKPPKSSPDVPDNKMPSVKPKDVDTKDSKPKDGDTKDGKPKDGKPKDDDSGGAQGQAGTPGCKLGCNTVGNPVNTAYGCKVQAGDLELDFDLPAPLPLPWQRTYVSDHAGIGWLGQGWSVPFSVQLQRSRDGLTLIDEQGRHIPLPEVQPGQSYYSRFEQFSVERNEAGSAYTLVFNSGQLRLYMHPLGLEADASVERRATALIYGLHALEDNNGNRIQLVYGAWPQGLQSATFEAEDAPALLVPEGIIDSAGRQLRLVFAPVGGRSEPRLPGNERGLRLVRVEQLSGPRGPEGEAPAALEEGRRVLVSYHYSAEGELIRVSDTLGQTRREFGWRNHIMVMHRDAAGFQSEYEYDSYTPRGKVLRNWLSDGQSWRLDYGAGETFVTHSGRDGALRSRKTWYHDDNKNYTGHRNESGAEVRRELDAFGNLQAVTDEAGHTTRYQLDLRGRPTQITLSDGSQSFIAYDEHSGQITRITTADGASTHYGYDRRGNLVRIIDALGQITYYWYDERGLPVQITDAQGKNKCLSYNGAGQLTCYTDCSGRSTYYAYDSWGRLACITDALGQETHYEHDAVGRLLRIEHPDGSVERMQYDSAGRLTAYLDAQGHSTDYELEADGLPRLRRNALGAELRYEYDRLRRLKRLINENGLSYEFEYDVQSRVVAETGFDGRHTRYAYDPSSQLKAKLELGTLSDAQRQARINVASSPPDERQPATAEDPWGIGESHHGVAADELPGGRIETRYTRDVLGRLIRKQVSGHLLDAQGRSIPQHKATRYEYDLMGRLSATSNDAGARSELAYDVLGQLRREARTGQGLSSVLHHRYDALGNRIQSTLPDGRNVHWLYYGSGHLHQIHVDGHVICDIERDALHREVLRTQGQLYSRYAHDAAGRLIRQASWRGAQSEAGEGPPGAWYALGAEGERSTGPTVLARGYRYDEVGNLLSIHDKHRGDTHYRYDAIGRIASASQNGSEERFAFDPAHNLLSKAVQGGRVSPNRLEVYEDKRYRYDTHGNVIEKKIGKHTVIRLVWDVDHQLTAAQVTRNGLTQQYQYQYDAFGRRIAKRDAFGQTLFTWDGNLLLSEARGSKSTLYLYEPQSFVPLAQLVDGEVSRDTETARDEPLQTTDEEDEDSAEGLNWNPRQVRHHFERQMQSAQRNIRAHLATATQAPRPRPVIRAVVEQEAKTWQIRYYHSDHLGTPRELSAEDGSIIWSASYRAWGNVLEEAWLPEEEGLAHQTQNRHAAERAKELAQQQNLSQNLRFQGQYFDAETGLHYNRFRYYDPEIGRFVSQDPIGLAGGINNYQYAPNPVTWVDPWGLKKKNTTTGKCKAANRCVQVTDKGIARVESHLSQFGPDTANEAMIQRLR